jgi:hypothetical protein
MSSEGLAHSEPLVARERRPAYGEGQFAYERPAGEEQFDRGTDRALALVIFTPVAAAYGAIAYGLYLAAEAIF